MAQKKRRRKKLDTSKLVCFLLVGSGLLITQECIYLMRLCIKSNYMASAAWLTAALSLAQVIIITGGKCYFELVKSDHKRGGITFEAAKANGFQEQDAWQKCHVRGFLFCAALAARYAVFISAH